MLCRRGCSIKVLCKRIVKRWLSYAPPKCIGIEAPFPRRVPSLPPAPVALFDVQGHVGSARADGEARCYLVWSCSLDANPMRKYASLIARASVLAVPPPRSSPTQGPSANNAKPRFVAERTAIGGSGFTFLATSCGAQPQPDKAEQALRRCFEAAPLVHSGVGITAKAWFLVSADSSGRPTVACAGRTDSLSDVTKKDSLGSAGNDAIILRNANLRNQEIVKACQEFPRDQLPLLAPWDLHAVVRHQQPSPTRGVYGVKKITTLLRICFDAHKS